MTSSEVMAWGASLGRKRSRLLIEAGRRVGSEVGECLAEMRLEGWQEREKGLSNQGN